MDGRTVLAAGLALLLAVTGCGSSKSSLPTARVEGAVTYRGQPVESGGVSFGPQESGHGQSIWAPLVQGRYSAPAVPLGKVRVQINAIVEEGTTKSEFGGTVRKRVNVVPDKYRGGVVLDVRGDMLEQNFELSQ